MSKLQVARVTQICRRCIRDWCRRRHENQTRCV